MFSSHNMNVILDMFLKDSQGRLKTHKRFISKQKDNIVRASVYGRNGLEQRYEFPFHSYLMHWPKFMYRAMTGTSQTWTQTSGSTTTTFPYYLNLSKTDASANHGIWAGTDDGTITPMSYNNYTLGDRIIQGYSTGQMSYDTTVVGDPEIDGIINKIVVSRNINNYSAATITVKELGIIGIDNASDYIMYVRDLFDNDGDPISIAVAANKTLTVEYEFYTLTDSGLNNNYMLWLEAVLRADTAVNFTDVDGDTISPSLNTDIAEMLACNAISGEDNYGIVVGTGEAENDEELYKLETKVSHGTGAGQLSYSGTTLTAPFYESGQMDFKIARSFTNNSGASIVTKEVGIYGEGLGAGQRLGFVRNDTIGVPIDNGETLEFIYTFRALI